VAQFSVKKPAQFWVKINTDKDRKLGIPVMKFERGA